MRKWLLIFTLLTSVGAWADDGLAQFCVVDGKSWDVLLNDFIAGWDNQGNFCEYKRFIAMNSLISLDMRANSDQYNQRMDQLYAFENKSEPVNYLEMAFQETWANQVVDAWLDLDDGLAAGKGSGALLNLIGVSLVSPHIKQYSSRPIVFLKTLLSGFFEKHKFTFGVKTKPLVTPSMAVGQRPATITAFVHPPLLPGQLDPVDDQTRSGFIEEFHDQILAAGAGAATGWVSGHFEDVGFRFIWPTWGSILSRANWSRTKFTDLSSPGMIASLAAAFYLADRAAQSEAYADFRKRVTISKTDLLTLANQILRDVNAKDNYQTWVHVEQLKNGLMLENYLLTRQNIQDLSNESERAKHQLRVHFADCGVSRDQTVAAQKAIFESRISANIEHERPNLEASLDITQSVQLILLKQSDPLVDPLIDTVRDLMLRDRMILESKIVVDSVWDDIVSAVSTVQAECKLLNSDSGVYP